MSQGRARIVWAALVAVSVGAVAVSLAVTEWRFLEPCHLCIFQRLLFMLLAVSTGIATLGGAHLVGRVAGALAALVAALGVGVATYQSWLQHEAVESLVSCTGGEPGPIERLVEWLGERWPTLFMPSGFCDDPGATFLGLSLANWSLIAFAACLLAAVWGIWRTLHV